MEAVNVEDEGRRHNTDVDILEEYDFSTGVRGKYATQYAEGSNIMPLDADVAEVFPDSVAVNQALRALAEIIRQRTDSTKRAN
jgi:hypothetical protein